jgi:hypothetical protein
MMRRIGFVQRYYMAADIPASPPAPAPAPSPQLPPQSPPASPPAPAPVAPPVAGPAAPWGTVNDRWNVDGKPWYEVYLPDGPTKDAYRTINPANPIVAADSHYNAQRMLSSLDQDKIIRIPDANAKPEDWDAVYKKLGRPDSPDGYKDVKWGDNADPTMVEFGKNLAFKLGLPPAAVEGVMAAQWNDFVGKQNEAYAKQAKEANDAAVAAIKQEAGDKYQEWMTAGNRVLEALKGSKAMSEADFAQLEAHIGVAPLLKMLVGLGRLMPSDGSFPQVTPQASPNEVKDQAAADRIAALQGDAAFMEKYNNAAHPEHASALEQMEKLYRAAGKFAPGA